MVGKFQLYGRKCQYGNGISTCYFTSILDEEVEEQLVARHKNAFTKCTLSTKY